MFNPNMLMQFMQFKNSFQGNPQQMVQQMLQSGQVSPERYQNAVQMAQQLQKILHGIRKNSAKLKQ